MSIERLPVTMRDFVSPTRRLRHPPHLLTRIAKRERRYQYYVRPVRPDGQEGRRSPWCGVTASDTAEHVVGSFEPIYHQGSIVPMFGDLNGDGTLDCVLRMDNGNVEMSQDPGVPVQIEAFASYGRSLCAKIFAGMTIATASPITFPSMCGTWMMMGEPR